MVPEPMGHPFVGSLLLTVTLKTAMVPESMGQPFVD